MSRSGRYNGVKIGINVSLVLFEDKLNRLYIFTGLPKSATCFCRVICVPNRFITQFVCDSDSFTTVARNVRCILLSPYLFQTGVVF